MIYNTELSFSENTSHNIVIYPFSETRDDIFRRTRSVETEGVAVRLIVIINRNWEGRVASHVSRANGLRFLSRREKILNFKIFWWGMSDLFSLLLRRNETLLILLTFHVSWQTSDTATLDQQTSDTATLDQQTVSVAVVTSAPWLTGGTQTPGTRCNKTSLQR